MRNNKDFGLPDSLLDAVRQVVEKKLDPVDPKELKGKHADRKDKDIDNDGDQDKSDEYLHHKLGNVAKRTDEEFSIREWQKKFYGNKRNLKWG